MKGHTIESLLHQIERAGLPAPVQGVALCPTALYVKLNFGDYLPGVPQLDLAWEEQRVGVILVPAEAQKRGRARRSAAEVWNRRHERRMVWCEASLEGWTPIAVTPRMIEDGAAVAAIRAALGRSRKTAAAAGEC